MGTLAFGTRSRPRFDPAEIEVMASVAHLVAVAMNRIETEKQLRESESRFRLLAELAPVGIVISDAHEKTLYASPKFTELFGYTLEDMPSVAQWWPLAYPDEALRTRVRQEWTAVVDAAKKTHLEIKPLEYPVSCKDGSVRQIEFRMAATSTLHVIVFTDITERKRAEEEREKLHVQLNQAQKMESIGRLAGGVAHDFNNMLGVIIGHSELAKEQLDPASQVFGDLEEIQKAAMRSADLTRQLLAFARRQTAVPKIIDLNDTVSGILRMLRRLIGEEIDLVWKPGATLWPVKLDPSQIDQILTNLCVNARDAIAGVGKITIETQNITLDESYCADHLEAGAGPYVMLAVSDNGFGMDKEALKNLFEPFFTTKGIGEGVGLGLATVYGIVKQNEGFINVYSEPGQGTTFKIYFQRTRQVLKAHEESAPKEIPTGTETVLLVEDEKAILNLGKTVLERFGYTVLVAHTPFEALAMAARYEGTIHLLVTDVVMPEMNGKALQEKIERIKPEIKVLYMSGYTANVIMHRGILETDVSFIQKPFTVASLAKKVREVLDQET